jgi:oligogalacturonide transport system substrate-binding protein
MAMRAHLFDADTGASLLADAAATPPGLRRRAAGSSGRGARRAATARSAARGLVGRRESATEATLKALAAFEAANPGLRVKAEYMGFNGYLEKLTTQMAGGSEPDLMQINWAWLAMFSKRGTGFLDLHAHRRPAGAATSSRPTTWPVRGAGPAERAAGSYTARCCCGTRPASARAGLALPTTWDELFAAGPQFRRTLGERAYPLDGELYDMMLLAQAWVHQSMAQPYVTRTSRAWP